MKVKKVLVTGANKGIGFGIAKHLGLSGWQVIIGARDKERAEKAIRELQALDIEVSGWVNIELTDLASLEKASKEINEKYPELSLLINNAGVDFYGTFGDTDGEVWDRVIGTDLTGEPDFTDYGNIGTDCLVVQ